MELWVALALLSVLFSGLFVFGQKVSAARGYSSNAITRTTLIGQGSVGIIGWILSGLSLQDITILLISALVAGIGYAIVNITRIISLNNIDAAIYFPIYKALSPLLVVIGGILIFSEQLSSLDSIGIVMGITVPLLLISRSEHMRQKSLAKGMAFLALGVIIASGTALISKVVADSNGDIFLFILMQAVFGFVLLLVTKGMGKRKQPQVSLNEKNHTWKEMLPLGLSTGILQGIAFFLVVKAYEFGPISIIYTINSFYILVPIILSVIIYREHINTRKIVAVGLSILAIVFFQF